MRTKRAERLLKVRAVSLEPRLEVYASYDGLAGLSERPILKDLLEEVERGNVPFVENQHGKETSTTLTKKEFLSRLRKKGSGKVFIYFNDFVSYGAGAGEEVAEFFFRTMPLFHEEASPPTEGKEKLVLLHAPGSMEEIEVTEH